VFDPSRTASSKMVHSGFPHSPAESLFTKVLEEVS
jgi:hypothetical protein